MHKTGLHASDYGCCSFNLGLKLQMTRAGGEWGKKKKKKKKSNFLYSFFFSLIFIFNFPQKIRKPFLTRTARYMQLLCLYSSIDQNNFFKLGNM